MEKLYAIKLSWRDRCSTIILPAGSEADAMAELYRVPEAFEVEGSDIVYKHLIYGLPVEVGEPRDITPSRIAAEFAKVLRDPDVTEYEMSYIIEAVANRILDYFSTNGGCEDAVEFEDFMRSIDAGSLCDDKELANFYEEERWQ